MRISNGNSYISPSTQLTLTEHDSGSLVPITDKAHISLRKKSEYHKDMLEVLEQVYARGYLAASKNNEQQAFNRVNSFLSYGKAWDLDQDLMENIAYTGKLNERCKRKAMHRAKTKGRKTPNLMDNMWAEEVGNHKYTVTRNIKSVIRKAYGTNV